MNWEALGAIAEILGSVGVILTLIYLAVQIRQSAKESHANSVHLLNLQIATIGDRLSNDAEMADIWVRGSESMASLLPAEKVRYGAALAQIFIASSTQYYLYSRKLVPGEMYDYVIAQLRDTLARPAVREWWGQNQHMYDPAFRAHVNDLIDAD